MNNMYDTQNVFAKILRGEIKINILAENDYAIAIRDINPQRKVHILVLPKAEYENFSSLIDGANPDEILGFWRLTNQVVDQLGLHESGYRLIMNTGKHGHQEVPHLHIHILGGEPVGALVEQHDKVSE